MIPFEKIYNSRVFRQTYFLAFTLYEVTKQEWALKLFAAVGDESLDVLDQLLINAFDWFDTQNGWLYWNNLHLLSNKKAGGAV